MARRLVILCLSFWLGLLPTLGQAFWWGEKAGSVSEIQLADLPAEARQTLLLIKHGGPFPYPRDGIPFGNREGLLPTQQRNYYREYTVPTPGVNHRGARRIIAGKAGDCWYSDDHYRSFRRIRELSGGAR